MLATMILAASLAPKIAGGPIEYKSADGTVLQGYFAWDGAKRGKRPLVLIVHDWNGVDAYEEGRARQLAELGYVGFAVDVFGKGERPTGAARGTLTGKYRNDVRLFRERLRAAFDAGTGLAQVDAKQVGAIGYCFGGGGVLEMGRAGLLVKALVTFHGSVAPSPDDKNIRGKTLVLHGDADPAAKPEQVWGFESGMKALRKPVRVVMYPGARHSFTVPPMGADTGGDYDADADKKSFVEMRAFLKAQFGR